MQYMYEEYITYHLAPLAHPHLALARSSGTRLSGSVIWEHSSSTTTVKLQPSSSDDCSSVQAVAPTTGHVRRALRRCRSAPAARAASSRLQGVAV